MSSLPFTWSPCDPSFPNNISLDAYADTVLTSVTFRQPLLSQYYMRFELCTALTTLSFPNATQCKALALNISSNPVLSSVSFASLIGDTPGSTYSFTIKDNPSLTTFSAPAWKPSLNLVYDFSGNAFTQAVVDAIIHRFYLQTLVGGPGYLLLNGGTSSAPSATGITERDDLIARGFIVNTN